MNTQNFSFTFFVLFSIPFVSGQICSKGSENTCTSGATAMGYDCEASGTYSTAMGYAAIASGESSTAMGYETDASGNYSTVMGYQSYASGSFSISAGHSTNSSGDTSVAMGSNSIASGLGSIAIGGANRASNSYSVALGSMSHSSGFASTAMGAVTSATGDGATAMGWNSHALGEYSTAMGYTSTAQSLASVTLGCGNIASGDPSKWIVTDPLFVVGNGWEYYSNALTLLKSGDMTIAGSFTQNADERLKENITPLLDVSSKLNHLRPILYNWKNKQVNGENTHIGILAQEVQEMFPELVMKDTEGYLSIDYSRLSVVLLQALKETEARLGQLEARLQIIEKFVNNNQ